MKRFVEGQSRTQGALLPESLDDFVAEANPVRVIDVFVDELAREALSTRTSPDKIDAAREGLRARVSALA